MGKQIRALKLTLETSASSIAKNSHVWHWLVGHAGWLLARFTVHANGKTSYQILKSNPNTVELASCGEWVWLRDLDPASKFDPRGY